MLNKTPEQEAADLAYRAAENIYVNSDFIGEDNYKHVTDFCTAEILKTIPLVEMLAALDKAQLMFYHVKAVTPEEDWATIHIMSELGGALEKLKQKGVGV